jgi:diguanylate cyclase (GGDEF)-like protein
VDRLTELHDRRYLEEFLEREIARAVRYERPLALLRLDVDHFERVNDRFGQLAGDAVLREVAATLRQQVRRETCCARYGDEEFAVVLPETHPDEARIVAERIRRAIEHRAFASKGVAIPVTISIGLASLEASMQSVESFFDLADRRLDDAKHAVPNRVG